MTKPTAYQQLVDLCRSRGKPVTAKELEAAGVKYASTVLNQFVTQGRVKKYGFNGREVPSTTRIEGAGFFPSNWHLPAPPLNPVLPAVLREEIAVVPARGAAAPAELDAMLDTMDDQTDAPRQSTPAPARAPSADPFEDLIAQLADQLAVRIAAQVQVRLADYLRQATECATAVEATPAPEPEPLPPVTKIKGEKLNVCIAGLLPQQAQMIEREFGKDLRLSFIGSDSNPKDARGKLGHADAALIMTKFVGHWLDRIFAEAKVPVFHRVTGGMSMLRDNLTSLYCST